MNIMLRWTRRIAIFLLLGAIVNVGVAWALIALQSPVGRDLACYENPHDNRFVTFVTTKSGCQFIENTTIDCALADQSAFFTKPYEGNVWWPATRSGRYASHQCRAGWPLPALEAWQITDRTVTQQFFYWDAEVSAKSFHWGIEFKRRGKTAGPQVNPVMLPMFPLWVGFFTNSAIYALPFAIIMTIASACRLLIRRFRNQCSVCGYPRGTSPVCTECGEPLPGVVAK